MLFKPAYNFIRPLYFFGQKLILINVAANQAQLLTRVLVVSRNDVEAL